LSHATRHFILLLIFVLVSHLFPRWPGQRSSILASHVVGMTAALHHAQIYCLRQGFSQMPQAAILLISAACVAGIRGVKHHAWPQAFAHEN
jgi:hypothetical protein